MMNADVKNNLFIFDKKNINKETIETLKHVFPNRMKQIEQFSVHRQSDIIASLYLMYRCLDDVSEKKIIYTPFGRPIADNFESFSISHSKDLSLLALFKADERVGVDVEYIRDVEEGAIKRLCNERELKAVKKKAIF